MNQILALILKEGKVLVRDRQALALLFAMPIFFILVMNFALEGVFEAGGKIRPVELLVIDGDEGILGKQILADLKKLEGLVIVETADGSPLSREKADHLILQGKYPLALLIPPDFSRQALQSSESNPETKGIMTFVHDPAMNARLLAGIKGSIQGVTLRRTLTARMAHRLKEALGTLALQSPMGLAPFPGLTNSLKALEGEGAKEGGGNSGVLFQSTSPQGLQTSRHPSTTEQNIPAYTIFGVFFIVLTLASSFFQEKRDGTFQRLLAAPISNITLLVGKLLPYYFVNLIQIALMFAVGVIFFKMGLGNLFALILVSLAVALAANGLGLFVAAVGKTEAQIGALSVLLAITLSALGGMMVPTFVMPDFMRALSFFTPHAWALSGYQDVIVRGLGVRQVLAETGALLAFAGLFFGLAFWRFRFH
jgi:ABC-2 type transport system permease protein